MAKKMNKTCIKPYKKRIFVLDIQKIYKMYNSCITQKRQINNTKRWVKVLLF